MRLLSLLFTLIPEVPTLSIVFNKLVRTSKGIADLFPAISLIIISDTCLSHYDEWFLTYAEAQYQRYGDTCSKYQDESINWKVRGTYIPVQFLDQDQAQVHRTKIALLKLHALIITCDNCKIGIKFQMVIFSIHVFTPSACFPAKWQMPLLQGKASTRKW